MDANLLSNFIMYLLLTTGQVLLGAVLYRRAVFSSRRAEAVYPPLGSFITVEGCRLHYVRAGSSGGASVVLLHGSDGFLQDFEQLMDGPSLEEFDLIAFDRPGHGYSMLIPGQPATMALQAHLIHSALQQLGISQSILVGHSWSAALCLFYALEYPQETVGIVLLSPWIYRTANPPSPLLHAARWIGSHLSIIFLTLPLVKRLLLKRSLKQAFYPAAIPDDYERKANALWLRTPEQIAAFVQENLDAWEHLEKLSKRYAEITAPLEIIIGDSDRTVDAQYHAHALHRAIPHSKLQIIPQAGHELPQTFPMVVQSAIIRCKEQADSGLAEPLAYSQHSNNFSLEKTEETLRRRARELVFQHGWNATAYQILNPDIQHWFSYDGTAVVGYASHFRTRVAAGAPICEESRLAEVVCDFEQDAMRYGERVCWFAATSRMQKALVNSTFHAALVIGAQPAWNPGHWLDILHKNASLRAQLNRAKHKGVVVTEWPAEHASENQGLQRCLDEWLEHHILPTLHFLTEPVTLDRLIDRRIFVAEVNSQPVGFLIATPVPSRNGWLVEQIVRAHGAVNGTAELMVDAVMRALALDGCEYITLGLVPLSQRERRAAKTPTLWLRMAMKWARLHGRRFYNFEGLDSFKAKFKPDSWEPLFAMSNEPRMSIRTLMAIMAAFSDGPLLWTFARAMAAAARQEAIWLWQRVKAIK